MVYVQLQKLQGSKTPKKMLWFNSNIKIDNE